MANDLTNRPLKVDTVMGAGAGLSRPLRVVKVYWENPTTAGNTFVIIDPTSSKVLLEGRAEANNQSQVFEFPVPITWRDFRVSTLASGTLWIYTR
jgi:hypothetical protein